MLLDIKRFALLFILFSTQATAEIIPVNEAQQQSRQWNRFVDDLYQMHLEQIQKHPVYKKMRVGGYSGRPRFYDEIEYYNKNTELLISTLQWERENPEKLHSISVSYYNEDGQVIKDYSAAFLPIHRNAPIQTLITLHYYNKGLHAYRVFDASLNRIYEVCKGQYQGKKVYLDLDDDYGELSEALETQDGIMSTPVYRACFGDREVDHSQLALPLSDS